MSRLVAAVLLLSSFATILHAQERTLVVSGLLNAPPQEVYDCFTTPEGIVKAWGVAKAKVDFRQGGQIRTAYEPDADLDSPKAIVNTILAYEPGCMLAIKPTAPEGSPEWLVAICESGFNVLRLEEAGPGRTRIVITGMGFKNGPHFDTAYDFFKKGNEWTIGHMQEVFGGKPDTAETTRVHEKLASLVGGTWRGQSVGPTGPKAAVNTYTQAMPPMIVAEGSLDLGEGLAPHGHAMFAPDDGAAGSAFWNFDENGRLARGHARLIGGERMVMDWNIQTVGGEPFKAYHVEMIFRGADEYLFRLFLGPVDLDRTDAPLVEVLYTRSPG